MVPVFVCVPARFGIIEKFQMAPAVPFQSIPVGYIKGWEFPDILDQEAHFPDYKKMGLRPKFYVQIIKARNGCRAANITAAVEVETLEDAQEIPGFVPFGELTESVYALPDKGINDNLERLSWAKKPSHNGVTRVLVADSYSHFLPPPYTDDGSFVVSLVPFGELGCLVFLKEDPDHAFVVPGFFAITDPVGEARRHKDSLP